MTFPIKNYFQYFSIVFKCIGNIRIKFQLFTLSYFRVSKIAGSKLTDNNPGITDLSDPNRPTRLAEIFGEIYDNVWTDTLEGLNKPKRIKTEKEAVLHMASILKVSMMLLINKHRK